MSETYIIGSEKIPVHSKGEITKTTRLRHTDPLEPNSTVQIIDTSKEIILQSLIIHFSQDDIAKDSFQIWFGDSQYTVLDKSQDSRYSSFIIPSFCVYDGIFETLINEPGNRVVSLKNKIRTKGLRIDLRNRDASNSFPMVLLAVYSEVE